MGEGRPGGWYKGGGPHARSSRHGIKELGGPKGLEPTRYGDWEVKGRVSDF